ncbi:MAG: hypothetical protein E6719_03445, partial [Dermabacter sp.]|nr:hypothetical protein [Dermabacter sp.]
VRTQSSPSAMRSRICDAQLSAGTARPTGDIHQIVVTVACITGLSPYLSTLYSRVLQPIVDK